MTTTLQELLGTENPTEILKLINLLVTQKSNIDLSNLSSDGQAILDQKASINLNNLSAAGQAILDAKIEAEALTEQNGYIKFKLNGISNSFIIQYGSVNLTGNPDYYNYPIAFTYIDSIKVIITSSYGSGHGGWSVVVKTAQPIAYGTDSSTAFYAKSNGNCHCQYIAIGY